MKKFKVITTAKWECEIECETEEEACDLYDPECYDNYEQSIEVEEV